MCHVILNNSEGSLYHFDLPLKRTNTSIRRVRTYVSALMRFAEDMKKAKSFVIRASVEFDSRFVANKFALRREVESCGLFK